MTLRRRFSALSIRLALVLLLVATAAADCKDRLCFHVTLSPEAATAPQSGRLLIFMQPGRHVSTGAFGLAADGYVAAQEVHDLKPGQTIDVDPDVLAFPKPFSQAPAGKYTIRAVLDTAHHWAYNQVLEPGDIAAKETRQQLKPASPQSVALTLSLTHKPAPLTLPANSELIDFTSPVLTKFWGRPIHMRGIILFPPSYSKSTDKYPTVFWTHGFSATLPYIAGYADGVRRLMYDGEIPEMIWIFLDESFPSGTHEFADSANNGPWGQALTTELIPHLESKYRMDARPSGRLLNGHSSGGWASLWLEVSYPDVFGGTWPTAPDPSDFRDFTGPDIYAPHANVYRKPDGSPWMLVRKGRKDVFSFRDFALQERVLGSYGGQMSSFEAVFSPRGPDGRPMPLFDRETGDVYPDVAQAWQKYDISRILRDNWATLGPKLNGKIHLIVGTEDTFHLDESARLLEQTIKDLGGHADFRYLPGRNHMNLYKDGLLQQIAKEMYAVARPKAAAASAGTQNQ